MTMPINPIGMDLLDWTDSMAYTLSAYGPIYRLDNRGDWKEWAAYVVNLPNLAILSPPNPADFDDWRAWAQRLVEVLS